MSDKGLKNKSAPGDALNGSSAASTTAVAEMWSPVMCISNPRYREVMGTAWRSRTSNSEGTALSILGAVPRSASQHHDA